MAQKLRWSRVRQIEGPTPIHRAARGPRISLSGKLPCRDQGRGRASSIIQIAARPLDRSSRVGRAGIQRLSTVPEQPGTGAADEVPAAPNGANRQLERVVIHRCHVSSSTPLSTTIHGYTQVFGLSSPGGKDREGTQVASHYLFLNCRAKQCQLFRITRFAASNLIRDTEQNRALPEMFLISVRLAL